jgi:hypothetical protein
MKKNLFLFLFPLIFSCSKPESETHEGFDIAIDTVFVDTGDDFIFLQGGLSHSDLTNDQKQLLNFSPRNELEVIDLDSLKLLHKIATEKEGSIGTGQPYAIQIDQTGRLVLFGFDEVRFFSSDLSSMKRYRLSPETLSGLGAEDILTFNSLRSNDGKYLFSIYENPDRIPQGIAKISFEEMSVKKVPLDLTSRIQPFIYSLFMDGRLRARGHDGVYIEVVDQRLIISTPYSNEVFVVDLESDAVTLKTFESKLTQNKKPFPIKTQGESMTEFLELRKEGQKSVTFGQFYFDKTQGRVWRFSQDLDKEIGDSLVFKSVLTVFDEDLNQIAEKVIPVDPFSKKFFKDSKLWSYVNVEDELGFAVIDFKF